AQTVMGSAKMVIESNTHPSILKDAVCSPEGTTISGVASLEKSGFRSAIIEAAIKSTERSREMRQKPKK
ncbi:MAG TPA: pyrroline-5-carboxylate reductase dimerization domain-containing protein, partial [Clostridia bacterium]|nr:pyrroline-5-carboxylate reductase dimerization domain-containing protein [Clostridia bacterium]